MAFFCLRRTARNAGEKDSNIILTRRIILLIFKKLFFLLLIFEVVIILYPNKTHRLALKVEVTQRPTVSKMSVFTFLFLKQLAQRHGLFTFSFIYFSAIRSRLPCAPFWSESVSGRRLVISVRSERLSRTSQSTAQDTNTV